jgi:hypothetical protein
MYDLAHGRGRADRRGVACCSAMSERLRPGLVPFFTLTTLLHAAAVLSRFDQFRDALPPVVHGALLCSQLPLLLLEAYFIDRLLADETGPKLATWMRIPRGPVRWSLALALTYLALFTLQTWELTIANIDPTPPEVWPPMQRLAWFSGFALIVTFPAYLAATTTLLPVLRVLLRPLRALPAALAVLVAIGLGGGAGLLALALVDVREGATFAALVDIKAAVTAEPLGALLITFAGPAIGGAFGLVRDALARRRGRGAGAD